MTALRILAIAVLLPCGLPVAAQTSRANGDSATPAETQFQSAIADNRYQPRLLSDPFIAQDRGPRSPKTQIAIVGPDDRMQDGALCYSMRSYKVARDDPHSDSTHATGYSTCQAARRFHVRSAGEETPRIDVVP